MNAYSPLLLSRRALLAGSGALAVAFAADAQEAPAKPAVKLPGSLNETPRLAGWVQVSPEGTVTVFTGKAELGQGIRTALIQVAAEQLYLRPEQVILVTADTARTANEGYTAGSHSMQDSGTAIMNAAAEVRGILVAEAASRFGLPAGQLVPADGRVTAPDGRSLGYGELVAGLSADRLAQPSAPLKDPATYSRDGQTVPPGGHPGQGYRRRSLCAGFAASRHAACPRGPAASLWRGAGQRG